jgi:hypothetical protein
MSEILRASAGEIWRPRRDLKKKTQRRKRIESACNTKYLRRLFDYGDLTAIPNHPPFYPAQTETVSGG